MKGVEAMSNEMNTCITLLRPMFDPRKNMWKIMKKTFNGSGGWARFGERWYWDRQDCIESINRIIANHPQQYEIDL